MFVPIFSERGREREREREKERERRRLTRQAGLEGDRQEEDHSGGERESDQIRMEEEEADNPGH